MVSRSLAFIVCIHWEFRQTCRVRFKSWCHQLSTHNLLRVCAGVEHHAVTVIDPVQSFNANRVILQSGLMSLAVNTVYGTILLEFLTTHTSEGDVYVSTT